jgi:hypothetical protein
VETKPSFVRAEGAVELYPKTAVNLNLSLVVHPGYPEDDLPFRFTYAFDDLVFQVFGMLHEHWSQGFKNLADRLVEFHLAGIAMQDLLVNRLKFFVNHEVHFHSPFVGIRIDAQKID